MLILFSFILLFSIAIVGYATKLKFKISISLVIPIGFIFLVAANQIIAIPFIVAKINSLYYSWVAVSMLVPLIAFAGFLIYKHRVNIEIKKDLPSFLVQILIIVFVFIWQTFRIKEISIWDIRTYGAFVNYLADNNPMNYYNIGNHNFTETLHIYNFNSFLAFQSLFARFIDFRTMYSLIIYPIYILSLIMTVYTILRHKLKIILSVIFSLMILFVLLWGYQPGEYATGTTFVVICILVSLYFIWVKKNNWIVLIVLVASIAFSTTTTIMLFPWIILFNIIWRKEVNKVTIISSCIILLFGSYAKAPTILFWIILPISIFIGILSLNFKPIIIKQKYIWFLLLSALIVISIGSSILWKTFYSDFWILRGATSINDTLLTPIILSSIVIISISLIFKLLFKQREITLEMFALLILNPITLSLLLGLFGTAQPRIFHITTAISIFILAENIGRVENKICSYNWKKSSLMYVALISLTVASTSFMNISNERRERTFKSFIFVKWGTENDGFKHQFDNIYKIIMENSDRNTSAKNITHPDSMEKISLYKPFLESYNGVSYLKVKKPDLLYGKLNDLPKYLKNNPWNIKAYKKIIKKGDNFVAII